MELRALRFGDGGQVATGWLVLSGGVVRAILTADGTDALLGYACDRRVRPTDGYLRFANLDVARRWLQQRLEPDSAGAAT